MIADNQDSGTFRIPFRKFSRTSNIRNLVAKYKRSSLAARKYSREFIIKKQTSSITSWLYTEVQEYVYFHHLTACLTKQPNFAVDAVSTRDERRCSCSRRFPSRSRALMLKTATGTFRQVDSAEETSIVLGIDASFAAFLLAAAALRGKRSTNTRVRSPIPFKFSLQE